MHIHFVQSIDIKDGGGLGIAALDLHKSIINFAKNNNSLQKTINISKDSSQRNLNSYLLSTSNKSRTCWQDGIITGKRAGPKSLFFSPELKKLSSKLLENAEWINGHGLYVWPNMWLGEEAKKRNLKLIYHPHGFFDPWILKRSKFKKYLAKILFENRNFNNVVLWRALTQKEANQIRETIGENVNVQVIPNGINLQEIDNIIKNLDKHKINEDLASGNESNIEELNCFSFKRERRLLFLGRLHPKKGLVNLITAWGRVTDKFKNWELSIVGPDQNGYKKILQKTISKNNCEHTCKIYKEVSGIRKHILINTCDAFILPSYSEGFPMSLLEAAAHSKPIIQSTECNFEELAKEEISWVCNTDVEDIQKNLEIALSVDDSELLDKGKAARELIEKKYTWDKICEKFLYYTDNL